MEPTEMEIVRLVIKGVVWIVVIISLCGAAKYGLRRHFDEKAAERRERNRKKEQ